jgi:predicted amidohydrolase YtcJ
MSAEPPALHPDADHGADRGADHGADLQGCPQVFLRNVRVVPVGGAPAPVGSVDLRLRGGRVVELAATLAPDRADEEVHDGGGRWVIPGLWDHHVHLAQWADTLSRLDLSGTASPDAVTERISQHLDTLSSQDADSLVVGFGHRSATWARQPTVAELDAVSGRHPVALVSGDGHNGWLNSAALALLGAPATDGALVENDWYPVWARIGDLAGAPEARDAAYRVAVSRAAAMGIVGVGDMEFGDGFRDWPRRFAAGIHDLRVRVATYPTGLDAVLAAGLRSGDILGDSRGLVRMGPLKIISDGSLNTRTAYCHEEYAGGSGLAEPRGRANYTVTDLTDLARRATQSGLRMAVHAIGDAAIGQALDVFEATGATGTIEHAQLVRPADIARMARLRVGASVQPAHLLDDRDVTALCWPDRADRCFPLREMVHAGVALLLGSDAPVSPLDPWLAMAAAVHRSADDRDPWNAAQSLTAAQALAGSTDGQTTVALGSRADLVLLEADPLGRDNEDSAEVGQRLRSMPVAATYLGGRRTFGGA